jgi:hypothetical protein
MRLNTHPTIRDTGLLVASLFAAVLALITAFPGKAAQLPAPPQTLIDTTYSPPSGETITVNAGDDFQSALNSAKLGDTIVLQAGASFKGNFVLPKKETGAGWIYIRSSNISSLPEPGKRVRPSDAVYMPKLVAYTSGKPVIQTAPAAQHYRFVGIEIKPAGGTWITNLVQLGDRDTSVDTLPRDIVFDRCYIHGDPDIGGRRGIVMDGIRVAIINSHISDFKENGADSQALWAYNTPGPIKIFNNFLEGAGENLMFGGADPKIVDLVPSDIEIRGNYFFIQLVWINQNWTVKNLLELKNARRVLIEGNVFENVWGAAQVGFAILFTPKNQNQSAPWTATQDIIFRLNKLINVGNGINISGRNTGVNGPTQQTKRVLIENNIFEVTGLNTRGIMFQVLGDVNDLIINHNTGFSPYSFASISMIDNSYYPDYLDFKNNLILRNNYGFKGNATQEGKGTLDRYFKNWNFAKNVLISASAKLYPSDNFFPSGISEVGFLDYSGGNYRLVATSPYKNAGSDGKDVGADIDAIDKAIAGGKHDSYILATPVNLKIVQ